MSVFYALIADIIRSHELPDRRCAQRIIHETLDRAAEDLALTQRPYATVGDELQAVSATLADALAFTIRTHLLLSDGLSLYFGIGIGTISKIEGAAGSGADDAPECLIQDGSAQWATCEAIEKVHHLQDAGRSLIRIWLRIHPGAIGGSGGGRSRRERIVNSILILRNQTIFRFQPRQRHIMAGFLMGVTQTEITRQGKVNQQVISEFAHSAGSPLLEVQKLLDGLNGGGEGE